MLSSGAPSRIVPFPSPVSRPDDLLCFTALKIKRDRADHEDPASALAPKLTFVMFFSRWLFWAFAQHRSASASAVFAARIASSTPSSRDSIWNGKPAPSPYLTQVA